MMMANAGAHVIDQRLSEWQARLLQLDRRNNLLYFKPGRSTVGVIDVTPDELDTRLRRARRGLTFDYTPPRLPRRRRGNSVALDEPDTDDPDPVVKPGDLKTNCNVADLQRQLLNLRRKDREWEEEQGLNVLFLAVGFLQWVDDAGEQARAPLVLIPCDLERASPRDPWRLRREDDDLVANTTLRHLLAKEYGVELPTLDNGSTDEESIEGYLDAVAERITGRDGWSVDHQIALGAFSYSKLAMYEDLERMRRDGIGSDLLRTIAGAPPRTDTGAGSSPPPPNDELAGGRLDDLLDLRDQYTVLPADFSQLQAIEQARTGGDLVIHGPPGTGKSQTIVNLIATLLTDGKRVLFVSEKTSALDVVKRRLEECELGVFCLDLHSDRGRKAEVYKQLQESIDAQRDGGGGWFDKRASGGGNHSIDELLERRERLNRVVRLLHEKREPLGLSVYEVQGRFARLLSHLRFENLKAPPATELTQEWVRLTGVAAQRIARRRQEYREHDSSPWIPLRASQEALALSDRIRSDMERTLAAIAGLRASVTPHMAWLGRPAVESAGDVRNAVALFTLLNDAPGVPAAWLERGALARLGRLHSEHSAQQRLRRDLEATLNEAFGGELPAVDYRDIRDAITLSPGEEEAIAGVAGAGWDRALGTDPASLTERVDELAAAAGQLTSCSETIADLLQQSPEHALGRIDAASALTARILAIAPVPEHWLERDALDELERECAEARSLAQKLGRDEAALSENFDAALSDLVDEAMLIRYRTDHQPFWRWARGAYRRDQKILKGRLHAPRSLPLAEALEAVELALEVRRGRERWGEKETGLRATLGARFHGRETDWDGVANDIEALRNLLEDWRDSAAILRELLIDGERRRALEAAAESLAAARLRYRQAVDALEHERLADSSASPPAIAETARRASPPLHRIRDAAADLVRNLAQPLAGFSALTELIKGGARLMAVREEDERLAPALAADFGQFYKGPETDWTAIAAALDWTRRFLDAAAGHTSDALRRHATDPQPAGDYSSRLVELEAALQNYAETLRALDGRFDVASTAWPAWSEAPLAELEAWATTCQTTAGEAPAWVDYRSAVHALDDRLGAGSVDALRRLTDRAGDVPAIIERQTYETWLEQIYGVEQALRAFAREDHEAIRKRFRELDEAFPIAVRQWVRQAAFSRYPGATPVQTGQLGILLQELSRKRPKRSVRRLIEDIPNVLQALKPCFLMSPLAVSQYLPAGPLASNRPHFDVVIFDEASQVPPYEAVPAIERARQVIVVGDRKQLPPWRGFQKGLGDDDDNDDDDPDPNTNGFEDRESILDAMVGQISAGVAEAYLDVHYRSRCESLIRFSNHAFYGNRLLTFPGPDPATACIRDVYLPDATYDAGGTATNRGEAERVAEIVFEMMGKSDEESVGVVALSRAQAELIDNLIEHGRFSRRDLDDRFREDRHERFFVKNLENIQGDERDHMILSIGYGPTPAGDVPNRFGPINHDGGERRLNVAVTRARKMMTVVHALRPEDITSPTAGARQLRRYLEYARNPDTALAAQVKGTGKPESPFEEAVLEALRARGYRVESQVGVSRYRIDLGIRAERGDGFDLGIECDGATYHSSPAARDRDWLRQQALEGLGWRIHRVWSTSWVRDRDGELTAIEEAIERARADLPSQPPPPPDDELPPDPDNHTQPPRNTPDAGPKPSPPMSSKPAAGKTSSTGKSDFFYEEYVRADVRPLRGAAHTFTVATLAERVVNIVKVEQPVHFETIVERLRSIMDIARAGARLRARIGAALDLAISSGAIERDGDFLRLTEQSATSVRPRRDPKRRIHHVADAELDAGLLLVTQQVYGATPPDLVRETARQFGWRRTGSDISMKLNERIERLVDNGQLLRQGDTLIATQRDHPR